MNSNVADANNLKKVPRGLEIRGEAASKILEEKKRIEGKKKISSCDKKHLDVFYAIKDAGVVIEE